MIELIPYAGTAIAAVAGTITLPRIPRLVRRRRETRGVRSREAREARIAELEAEVRDPIEDVIARIDRELSPPPPPRSIAERLEETAREHLDTTGGTPTFAWRDGMGNRHRQEIEKPSFSLALDTLACQDCRVDGKVIWPCREKHLEKWREHARKARKKADRKPWRPCGA